MSRVSQAAIIAALVVMTGCAAKPKEIAAVPLPPPPAVPVYVTPPISPINRGLSEAATVWHVRSALNVAALACRGAGEAEIVRRYNAMLATHKTTLAGAQTTLSAEYKAGGGDWQDRYDDAMTRLYNFFSQAQARDAFCTAAAATLAESERLTPGELQRFAAVVLPTLDAPFAEMAMPRQVIAVASSGMGPVVAPVSYAPRPVAATPAAPRPIASPVAAPQPAVAATRAPMPAIGTRAAAIPPAPIGRTPKVATPAANASTQVVPKLNLDLSGL
ncbi:hypothetical protein F1C10_08900 [Sphingomonas sp. NBWT7]|uniref:hypothetical protein n=1 Tax=Sphingomonas sp. NBWT7 TaxID=2596913 RepID=UPI0016282B16|nr:hypothetical protein [Sphingomonas sp. NBWT7]QNE32047.1 hypothetical protein F1C10_08900 [Sphingomonas sp. NBWT7]